MELKIYSPKEGDFAQVIKWNFNELKTEITDTVQNYATSVYTDDTIKQAKEDRAKLRKFVDAMETKRKEVKKAVLTPYEQFEKEEKELVGVVQIAIDNIECQIKGYEGRRREEKKAKILEFYEENIHDLSAYLPFDRVFRSEYVNASVTMKSIKEEILLLVQKVDEGLAILNEVDSKFAGDMKEEFLLNYDIGAALAKRNQLETAEQKRREYEAEQSKIRKEKETRQKAEAERVMAAGRQERVELPKPSLPVASNEVDTIDDPVYVIDFRVHATASQLAELKHYLKNNKIRFEPVTNK